MSKKIDPLPPSSNEEFWAPEHDTLLESKTKKEILEEVKRRKTLLAKAEPRVEGDRFVVEVDGFKVGLPISPKDYRLEKGKFVKAGT